MLIEAIGAFAASALLYWAILRMTFLPKVQIDLRVSALSKSNGMAVGKVARQGRLGLSRYGRGQWMARLDVLLKKADIELTAQMFAIRWAMVMAICGGLASLALGWAGILCLFSTGPLMTLFYLQLRGKKRTRRFNDGLYDALVMMSNAMRAGHSFLQAMQLVCADMEGPIQEEFQRVHAETQVGVGVDDALERANERVGSEDFDLMITAIAIQRQIGGNLSEVLDKIAETIRDRVKLQREVKALTAQGRLSALIFMMLPVGVGLILSMMNPTYLGTLTHTPVGWVLLVLAGLGQIVGYFFIQRIVRIEL